MLDKLERLEKEFQEIEGQLADSAVIADQALYTKLSRRYKALSKAAALSKRWRDAQGSLTEAKEVLASDDGEMRELASEQKGEAEKELEVLEAEAKLELLPKDPNDNKDCIIEIRAGAGGDEAGLFAGELARMYMRYGEDNGLSSELLSRSEGSPGVVKEVVFALRGDNAYGKMKYESGVHRVQRIPSTESQGRIHTSTASVAVLPEAEEVDIEIKESDLKVDVFRSSGPGGQSVNTTDSAVRMTHIPTGITVSCQDEKSQLKNRSKALQIMRTRLYDIERERLAKERGEERLSQIGSGDRSEKIRTYNFPQDRVTDHRIKMNLSNLPGVMDGKIEEFVDGLRLADQEEMMKKLGS